MTSRIIKSYSELITLPTFEERLSYLQTGSKVGVDTFGFDRIFNQKFYTSREWQIVRQHVILRDNGCDLGIAGREIPEGLSVIIHHINPISIEDIKLSTDMLLNPEYLITTIHSTHNLIHYGCADRINLSAERMPNDTCPWKNRRITNGR